MSVRALKYAGLNRTRETALVVVCKVNCSLVPNLCNNNMNNSDIWNRV